MVRRLVLAVGGLAAVLGCSAAPESGPAPVVFGRDACERCQMLIDAPRFAVQLRTEDHRAHRFDDLGCALLWLDDERAGAAPLEIWVGDPAGGDWLDGSAALYGPGWRTPMGYGLAPARVEAEGVALAQAWEQIRRLERERRRD